MYRYFLLAVSLFLILSCAGPSPRYSSLDSSGYSRSSASDKKSTKKKSSSTKKKSSSKQTSAKKSELKGGASWYGPGFHGKTTANGEKFNMYAMTAAHKTLKFGTIVEVTDLDTGKKVRVRINDRGPYAKGRIIDLSKKAAKKLGMIDKGHAQVSLRIIK